MDIIKDLLLSTNFLNLNNINYDIKINKIEYIDYIIDNIKFIEADIITIKEIIPIIVYAPLLIYIELYNVDNDKKYFLIFDQKKEYNIFINNNNIYINVNNYLQSILNIDILDNELHNLGYDKYGSDLYYFHTFVRKKHLVKLKKIINNNNKFIYFNNKKKINLLFLYNLRFYSLYIKFNIWNSIKDYVNIFN